MTSVFASVNKGEIATGRLRAAQPARAAASVPTTTAGSPHEPVAAGSCDTTTARGRQQQQLIRYTRQLTLCQLMVFSARASTHALLEAEQGIYTTHSNHRKQFGRNLGAQAILTVAILFHERATSRAVRPLIDLCQISRIGSLAGSAGSDRFTPLPRRWRDPERVRSRCGRSGDR